MLLVNGRTYFCGDGIGDVFTSIIDKDTVMGLTKSVVSGASNAFAQNIGKKGGTKLAEKVNEILSDNNILSNEYDLKKIHNLAPNLSELYGAGLRILK